MSNIVDKVFDNTEDGKPNYAIQLLDGSRLYCRELLNPVPKSGDAIDYTIINVKTSSKGNPYTNVKNVKIADNHTLDDDLPTGEYPTVGRSITTSATSSSYSTPMNKSDTQRMYRS